MLYVSTPLTERLPPISTTDPSFALPLPRGGVALRVTHDSVAIVGPHKRRWWQLWKPKFSTATLATATLSEPPAAGSRVALEQCGASRFIATVNDKVVLRYGAETSSSRYHGIGFVAGPQGVMVKPWSSDPTTTVES